MKKRVAILISGGGSNMLTLVNSMQDAAHPGEPVLVLSNNPDAGGLEKAAALGVPTAAVDHKPFKGDRTAFEAELIKPLLQAKPDVICYAGFMRILTPEFVAKFEDRMINIHPSLLPKYKGLNTHARAIEAGDTEAGCTVHKLTAELDDGPILGQSRVLIDPGETPDSLAAKVLIQEHKLYPMVLKRLLLGQTQRVDLS